MIFTDVLPSSFSTLGGGPAHFQARCLSINLAPDHTGTGQRPIVLTRLLLDHRHALTGWAFGRKRRVRGHPDTWRPLELSAVLDPSYTDKPRKYSPTFMPFVFRFSSKLPSTIKQTDDGWDN